MATQLDPNELVTFKELLISNSIQIDAAVQLLIDKGLITGRIFHQTETGPSAISGQAEWLRRSSPADRPEPTGLLLISLSNTRSPMVDGPKGRIARTARWDKKYRLTDMPPPATRKERNERHWFRRHRHILAWSADRWVCLHQNDGQKHAKPHLHIDLDKDDIFKRPFSCGVIDLNEIKPSTWPAQGIKDPRIYEKVTDVLKNELVLESRGRDCPAHPSSTKTQSQEF